MKKRVNGTGSVFRDKHNVKNPWRAAIATKNEQTGQCLRYSLGSYPTKAEALNVLDYIAGKKESPFYTGTFEDVFVEWLSKRQLTDQHATHQVLMAYHYCFPIHPKVFVFITKRDLISCMRGYVMEYDPLDIKKENGKKKYASISVSHRIKNLLNALYDYACEQGYIDFNLSRSFSISEIQNKRTGKTKRTYTAIRDEDLSILWESQGNPYIRMTLICIYCCINPKHFCASKMDDQFLIADLGVHTYLYAIHQRVRPLFIDLNIPTYDVFRKRFEEIIKHLNMNYAMGDISETSKQKMEEANLHSPLLIKDSHWLNPALCQKKKEELQTRIKKLC